jgi:hypothetical protein
MNPSSPLHPPEETIERYVQGKLSDAELDVFEEHLLACVPCQTSAEELDTFIRATRAAAQALRQGPPSRLEWFRSMLISGPRMAWTAAIVAAAALILVIPARNPGSQAISLAVTRGSEPPVHARANVPIDLRLGVAGLGSSTDLFVIEVVDAAGSVVDTYKAPPAGDELAVKIPARLGAGQYWIRLYASTKNEQKNQPKSDLLREFGLTVD